jgi:phosphoglycolate phosphatase-like HAD superfamily hydrolase
MSNRPPNPQTARDVFALDFDGVLCDSAPEGAVTAWQAGQKLWPEWQGAEPPEEFKDRFVRLRPALETGYQMPLLMKLVADRVDDAEVLARFVPLCDELMSRHGLTRRQLVDLFGKARDEWIARDTAGWLASHRFYPGILARLREALVSHPVYILTTKQERFSWQLLEAGGAAVPRERIWGLERNLTKARMLELVLADPAHCGSRVHFLEDRVETLSEVAKNPLLAGVCLYLADWGYNTEAQREQARRHPRITLWSLDQFLDV